MKTLNYLKPLLFLLTVVVFTSCSDDDEDMKIEEPLNIVEIAQNTPELSLLVEAVIQTDLVSALSADGEMTVLAPTNTAFSAFLSAKGFASLSEVPNDVLTQILLNHVIGGTNIESSALIGNMGYTNTLADGPNSSKLSLYYDGTSGVMFNGSSSVTIPDIEASNGIIHVVDAVIDLPTIATFATSNTALSTLVDVLAYADTGMPTVPYIETVSDATAGPFTVFAPTNDAFVALLPELGVTMLSEISTDTIDAVLLHHIVNANVQSSQLVSGTVSTLGGDITADASAYTLTDANDRVSNIITSLVDIQATNGVVHVIDKVILP